MARIVREHGSRAEVAWAETGTLAVPGAQARAARGADHDPRGAAADRRLSGAAERRGARDHRPRLPVGPCLRRRALGRADERRPGDPSAADGDERGAAAALRPLGHPRRRHAAGGARRDRPARPRAHRRARGARLRRAALSARRPLRQRPLDVRRRAQEAGRLGRLARAHRPAHAPLRQPRTPSSASPSSPRWRAGRGVDAPVAHGLLAVTGGFLGRDLRLGPRTLEALGLAELDRAGLQQRLHDGE